MSDETGDEIHVRITCPHCRKQFQKAAAWINANDYVRCDFCRQPIGLNAYKRKTVAVEAPAKPPAASAKPPKRKR
ncbi:MAG TPA: hypothetical protein VGP86_01060 [Xanthobacteraceae bacterium]|jgi:hypothetical protein|nr:hypothetical protein [Xanthobacteraceae bacterium]